MRRQVSCARGSEVIPVGLYLEFGPPHLLQTQFPHRCQARNRSPLSPHCENVCALGTSMDRSVKARCGAAL